ncbi:MarR family winged helix-turn-helix transcriptional regulator [Streptomyces sp. NPDC047081]|uniref:MarR family winged helix-turn-helix transcriptional regulator n=1 Tax=Streptomyces sp. NPDC047081 TaxID=3154706 RepID=UPI0033DADC52
MSTSQEETRKPGSGRGTASPGPEADALQAIAEQTELLRAFTVAVEAARGEAVAAALAAGATWLQLGDVLGTTPQAAHKRYASARRPTDGAGHAAEPADQAYLLDRLIAVRVVRLAELIQTTTTALVEAPHGLGHNDLRVIRLLDHAPLTVSQLSRRARVDKAGVSRSVSRLVKRDLVERVPAASSSMARYRLTAQGDAMVKSLAPISLDRQRALLGNLPESAAVLILDLLLRNAEVAVRQLSDPPRQ